MIKKLLLLIFTTSTISTGIYFGTKKSNNLTSHSLPERESTGPNLIKDSKKYCRVLLSSENFVYEVLLCFDFDKANSLNKSTYDLEHRNMEQYTGALFLLDKTYERYLISKIDGLSSERKVKGYKEYQLRETSWKAFRYKKQIAMELTWEAKRELVGNSFTIKARPYFSQEIEEGFLFPSDNTDTMQYMFQSNDYAIFSDRDLITGSLTKNPWGAYGESKKSFKIVAPLVTDPYDTRLTEHKQKSKYQIISESLWASDSFSCDPPAQQEKIVLSCH
ncbi:hypothetical protein WEN_01240 [Mycoplasma wenyonii str. Massachusetts]|uniref:Uncharacterized protein n=1 Tax=Mycoplasma wenyonii (strain Massachusetts) TaxID=1197325 RepID=I6ZEM7_MYCWM|nr:hypothetical protein [Mycoplasma wenyonii]AFN65047.1 hypothetical protein WEN_01240 [Mycoplasma wenyonii str. Massachusetts]